MSGYHLRFDAPLPDLWDDDHAASLDDPAVLLRNAAAYMAPGCQLAVTVPGTFAELALGSEVKVPAHRGAPVTVRIPPGTANGSKFRVSGKGVRRKDGTTGSLIVTVEVMVPQNLNGKARSAIEDLREATAGADPREELLARAKETL